MLKKIRSKARPRIFKSGMSKSRCKSNLCVGMAVFLLLLSVSLLHTKLGVHTTLEMKSLQVSTFPAGRKELTSRDTEARVLDKAFSTRFADDSLERRENLEEDSDENDATEEFDGFEDKIDEMDEDADEGMGDSFGVSQEKDLETQGAENDSQGSETDGKSNGTPEGRDNSGKRLERTGQIKSITRANNSDEQRKTTDYIQSKEMRTQKIVSLRGRAGLFWDHAMGVTRKAFPKRPQRLAAISNTANSKSGHGQESKIDIDIQINGEWEDAIADDSVAGSDERMKQTFSSDDQPIDEGIRNGLEEVYAIEDALLLKGGERSSPLRSGWGPWFDTIQRRASKSDFLRRDKMARSTVDLLNPMNNPLLQDPDAIGSAGLTKSDKAIQKALKKASIEGIPFVGKQSFTSKDAAEEETGVEGKEQVRDAVALQKTPEDGNLDGGDEASLKERNNSDNDDDASLKTGLPQLTRKALDESDNQIRLESNVDGKSSRDFTETLRGTERIQSVMPEQVVERERKKLSNQDLEDNTRSLGKNPERSKIDTHRSNSRRNKLQFQNKGIHDKDKTREFKFQAYGNGNLLDQKNGSRVQSRDVFSRDNVVISNKSTTEDVDGIASIKMGVARGDAMENARGKTTGIENYERKMQRRREPRKLNSTSKKKAHRKVRLDGDTRRWGHFPGLDPLLSFSEFMDEFFQNGNCSLRVFMAWTTPPWSYSVKYQRGLESLFYFHPHACVMVLSDTIELDVFNDFVNDGYRIAVIMPNLDELLVNTPAHIFASVWLDWRKVDFYYIHYTELLRLAVLYKYGGIYLDSDIVVLKALDSLNNTIGTVSPSNKDFTLNGAVMAFEKHSPFLLECLSEFTATYEDNLLTWNGAELLTRVAKRSIEQSDQSWVHKDFKIQPHQEFFPLSFYNISNYFTAPNTQYDKEVQEVLLNRILNESFTLHLWNSATSKLVPESGSLVERILNYHCLHCTDLL
ncbi:hypothetical protein SUGI_0397500 [Cryptomeria japonica]|uniref:uncharacterized protein At4g19900 n=1 Tax=Cryptomeria japonica TaxID=3369 RepID=UPI002408974A|nr:uncharacterized protein At4g19900 [Cryptomeria japonica]GLJ21503.1 hypothetical protein SUGI_0397500 [Cryptomeria japonica]